jgi:hypothetical protein
MEFARYENGKLIRHCIDNGYVQEKPLDWQLKGLTKTASGYGTKIPTTKVISLDGFDRLRRIYCDIFSNIGICYVIKNGLKQIVF